MVSSLIVSYPVTKAGSLTPLWSLSALLVLLLGLLWDPVWLPHNRIIVAITPANNFYMGTGDVNLVLMLERHDHYPLSQLPRPWR